MAVTPVRLIGGVQLAGAVATLFTGPSGVNTQIKRAVFTNQDTANHQITVYIIKAGGGAAAASNCIINAQNIAPLQAYVAPELAGLVIGVGDTLQAFADTGAMVTVTASGFQM